MCERRTLIHLEMVPSHCGWRDKNSHKIAEGPITLIVGGRRTLIQLEKFPLHWWFVGEELSHNCRRSSHIGGWWEKNSYTLGEGPLTLVVGGRRNLGVLILKYIGA